MISVIVPSRNRGELIDEFLKCIQKQTLNNSSFEVLIIDNGSTDNTQEIVEKHKKDSFIDIKYFYEDKPGLHNGRHFGLKMSSGDILVFADDDVLPNPKWLQSIHESFLRSDVMMVGGDNMPNFEEHPPRWLKTLWEKKDKNNIQSIWMLSIINFNKNQICEIHPSQIWGCNFSIRRSVLNETMGFHPDGMPDHQILLRGDGECYVTNYVAKKNYKCLYHPDAHVRHLVSKNRMTFNYIRKRGFNEGISASYSDLRNAYDTISQMQNIKKIIRLNIEKLKFIFLDKDIKHMYKCFNEGYKEAYLLHQNSYKADASIRNWVHKKNYL